MFKKVIFIRMVCLKLKTKRLLWDDDDQFGISQES